MRPVLMCWTNCHFSCSDQNRFSGGGVGDDAFLLRRRFIVLGTAVPNQVGGIPVHGLFHALSLDCLLPTYNFYGIREQRKTSVLQVGSFYLLKFLIKW